MKKFLAVLVVAVAMVPMTVSAERTRECPRNVVCLEGEILEVDVQRPRAFYVIDRSRLQHQQTSPDQSFTNDILESVDTGPF